MMELSSMMRLTIFMAMMGSLFFPWGIASDITVASLVTSAVVMAVKMVLVAFILSLVESALCKTRLFKTPNLLTASFTLSLLAMISLYIL